MTVSDLIFEAPRIPIVKYGKYKTEMQTVLWH